MITATFQMILTQSMFGRPSRTGRYTSSCSSAWLVSVQSTASLCSYQPSSSTSILPTSAEFANAFEKHGLFSERCAADVGSSLCVRLLLHHLSQLVRRSCSQARHLHAWLPARCHCRILYACSDRKAEGAVRRYCACCDRHIPPDPTGHGMEQCKHWRKLEERNRYRYAGMVSCHSPVQ